MKHKLSDNFIKDIKKSYSAPKTETSPVKVQPLTSE